MISPEHRPSVERSLQIHAFADILNFVSEQGSTRPDLDPVALHDDGIETFYGWPPAQRSRAAAIHAIAHRHGLIAFGIDYSSEPSEPVALLDPHLLAQKFEAIVRTRDRSYSLLILVWAAHTHLIARFNSTFYLGFQGKTGSGKGTAIETCIHLAPNGVVLSDASDAYLASVLNEGRAIGLEEWDSLVRKNPGIEALLRNGYRRGATRGIMVQKGHGKKWEEATLSLFGPKVYDTHAGPSGHLLGRSVIVPMEPDDSVDRALDAEGKSELLEPIRGLIEGRAKRALAEWPQERVDTHLRSQEFRRRVAGMGGRNGRDHVVAALVLVTCDMMEWGLEPELRPIISGRTTVEEFGIEVEVIEAIRRLCPDCGTETELRTDLILGEVNRQRGTTGVTARLTAKSLGAALRELSFKRGPEWGRAKSGPNRDATVTRPFRVLKDWADREPSTSDAACPSSPSCPPLRDEVGGMGSVGTQNPGPSLVDPGATFGGGMVAAELARVSASGLSDGEPTELDRAVVNLGPTITYPDGTIANRRTGAVLSRPAGPADAGGRPGGAS
jgi:hypothetical protein